MYEMVEKLAAKKQNRTSQDVGMAALIGGLGTGAGVAGLGGGISYLNRRLTHGITREVTPASLRITGRRGFPFVNVAREAKSVKVNRPGGIIGKGIRNARRGIVSVERRLGRNKGKAAILGAALLLGAGAGAGVGYLRNQNRKQSYT